MINPRRTAVTVANTNIVKRTEDIKKVDIDIFKSGESSIVSHTYSLQELVPGTPIKLLFIEENTGYMRFKINLDGKTKFVSKLILDSEEVIKPQLTVDEFGLAHYEFGFKMKDPRGLHYMNLKVGVSKKDASGEIILDAQKNPIAESYINYLYKFHTLVRDKSQMSIVDIPVDSYRDSLLNVTKLWLLSGKYDRVRRPDWAGFFDDRLRRYPMNEEGARQVEKELMQAIATKIEDVLITDCKATPKLADRSWEVSVTSTDYKTQVSTLNLPETEKAVLINVNNENARQDGQPISILQTIDTGL